MARHLIGLVAALPLAAFACSAPEHSARTRAGSPAAPPRTLFARAAITDVTIALTKPDGRPWDGPANTISPEDLSAFRAAMADSHPVVALLAVLERPTVRAIDKPDLKGSATLFLRGTAQAREAFRGQRDTIQPMLAPQPVWFHVPLDGTASIELDAFDDDFAFDDPIGTAIIRADALATAASEGGVYQVNVAQQTRSSILFVGINVMPE